MQSGRKADFRKFREQYPYFEYQHYRVRHEKKELIFTYQFSLSGKYTFSPSLHFQPHHLFNLPDTKTINNLAFHIGMIELISYWKAACPPVIYIRPHSLSTQAVDFWKQLYWNGLGEFFYLNGIETKADDFVDIQVTGQNGLETSSIKAVEDRVLVPVGGGKDSAVTLELLANSRHEVIPFMLNPNPAMIRTLESAGIERSRSMIVKRNIDPLLLELNQQGLLNGHTPFSALLAFVAATAAALTQTEHIALSNESSANEATIPGTHINHQYSKSLHFEHAFRNYLTNYITTDINYFSFLRPLNEMQIAWLFSRMPQYHSTFRSCNAGSKTDSWCGQCPKCLFTFTILSPFLSRTELIRIFGHDLFSDNRLSGLLESLAGLTSEKPFECVGTTDEVCIALDYLNQRNHSLNAGLPEILKNKITTKQNLDGLLGSFDSHHFLNPHFETFLRNSMND